MNSKLSDILTSNGLKVTPQRLAVLESLITLKNHPTVETIREFVHKNYPSISLGTIYNTLETFVKKGVIRKIKTDKDYTRYDIIVENHHHIYCDNCDIIENYFDKELDKILFDYFDKHPIANWEIKEINLQISGIYNSQNENQNKNKH